MYVGGKVTKVAISGKFWVLPPSAFSRTVQLQLSDGQNVDGESIKLEPGTSADDNVEGLFRCELAAISPPKPVVCLSYKAVDHCRRLPLSIRAQV